MGASIATRAPMSITGVDFAAAASERGGFIRSGVCEGAISATGVRIQPCTLIRAGRSVSGQRYAGAAPSYRAMICQSWR